MRDEFQKEILSHTPETIVELYDDTYGALNRYLDSIMGGLLMQRAEKIKEIQNNNRDPNSSDPTHTQIAKDHPTHPLHILAAELASHAVFELGTAIAKAWERKATVAEVIHVAEQHWAHPQAATWMDSKVSQWAKNNPEKIKLAASRQDLEDQALEHEAAFEQRILDTFPHYAKAASHIDEILKG